MSLQTIDLKSWNFALGEECSCLEAGRRVTVPHTWNIEEGTEDHWGIGWYSCGFVPEDSWRDKRVEVLFRAVYHDAAVYLNGQQVGVHKNSGYTPFSLELTKGIRFGEENRLTVRVDNRFSPEMLPCQRSFDWANDGGLIRPVRLLITGKCRFQNLKVTARPVITTFEERQDEGRAVFGLQGGIEGQDLSTRVCWELYEGCDGNETLVTSGEALCRDGEVRLPGMVLEQVRYWHFDSPRLYTVKLTLEAGGAVQDRESIVFGFRDFHAQGPNFYLNGEPVRIPGTEWMPGSDPAFGMAEPKEQLEKMLGCLRGSNSILTRFHWQQDEWVYDWCDRHGMLVQEEVPFWGRDPEKAGERQWEIFKEQIGEMVAAHRNHPSIIAWGVGNELDAQCGETIQYIKDAVAYTHRLDPERLANYVSNSIFQGHSLDGTTDGDVMMVNDYIGTWHQGYDQYGEWEAIVKANPDRAMIPSEFGLCEPAFTGGDRRREEIFLEKLACYRKYPNIAGTIYFCLNDYRTQMGEDGEGRLRKRVHGSTGLCGEPKPSYRTVRKEYSPILLRAEGEKLAVECRRDLPSYTVKGYYLEKEGRRILIPDLRPGEVWVTEESAAEEKAVLARRPDGTLLW